MGNYTKITNFTAKDALLTGNPNKIITGTGLDAEFDAISIAIASKGDTTGQTFVTPNIGTPSAGTLTNCTGLPLTTGVTGTLPVANGGTGVTTSTGTGNVVLSDSPTLVTPALGTPSALVGTNITGTAAGLSIGGTAANVTGTVAVANGGTGVTTIAGILTALGLRPSTAAWQSLAFAFGSSYQNTEAYEIVVAVYGTNGSQPNFQVSSDNVNWYSVFQFQAAGGGCVVPVPAGHYYRTTVGGGSVYFSSVLK